MLFSSLIATCLILGSSSARAGTATYDFTSDPASDPNLRIVGNNETPWQATTGNPGGFLAITYSINSQFTGVVFPDIDTGKVVTSFKFECDLRVGNPNGNAGRPADGFSISFARGNDPLLESLPDSAANTGNFAGGIPEGGSTTGIAISFDTWSGNTLPDGPDIEGIIVRVDNKTILRQPLPTRNGACNDITSLQTGPYNQAYYDNGGEPTDPAAWADLCWQPFLVELDSTGKLTVAYKGNTILNAFQTSYFPSVGRLILAGRTGGANENTHVDNIKLTTTARDIDANPPTVPQNPVVGRTSTSRVELSWGAATDDSGQVAYEIERDGTLLDTGLISGTSYVDAGLKSDTTYSYKVRAVDGSLNKSAFSAAATGKTGRENPVETPGFAKFEAWNNISSTAVDALTSDPRFPDSPDFSSIATALDTRTVYPNDSHENYGGRLRAFLIPKETGNYELFLRSDDASQLFLSTDQNEANLTQIAEETGCCDAYHESGDPETSAPIALQAGRKYLLQVLWKEGGGGDYAQVAWRKQGDATPAASLRPIPGEFLSALVDATQGAPIITVQPQSSTVAAGGSSTFSVSAAGTAPFTYQWKLNGTDIPTGTNNTLTVSNATYPQSAGAYTVTVSNWEGSATSQEARLTFTGVPTILFVHGTSGPNDSDRAIMRRLESQGWQVSAVGAVPVQTSDADGKALIITSSTVASGEVGDKFRTVAVPVINWEAALQDNYDMTDRANDADGTTRGVTGGQTQLNIVKADHPIAAGLGAGLKTHLSSAQDASWGVVGPGATVIATIADDPTRAALYVYDKDATIFDGTTKAAEKRLHFAAGDNTFLGLNADGLKLWDAAVEYAAGKPTGNPPQSNIAISRAQGQISITYQGTLQSAAQVTGPYSAVAGATSPYNVTPEGAARFYIVR